MAHADGPPPAHTGGFGEPTCQQCHTGNALNDSLGRLRVEGQPAAYVANQAYRFSIVLSRPGLAAGGFQLAARTREDGRQAGELTPADERTALVPGSVQYIQHTRKGAMRWAADTARWEIVWRAPSRANAVVFHIAANAAGDDNSPLDDFIYTQEIVLSPRP